MDGSNAFPQCLPTLRFHEMAQEGSLSDEELRAVATDRRVGGEYEALRQCDQAFQEMIEAGNKEMQRLQKRGHQHEQDASPVDGMSSNEVKYVGYVHCVSTALCPDSLKEWYNCLEQVKAGNQPVESCTVVKHMLERCLRAETDALFRASQKRVFRPSS